MLPQGIPLNNDCLYNANPQFFKTIIPKISQFCFITFPINLLSHVFYLLSVYRFNAGVYRRRQRRSFADSSSHTDSTCLTQISRNKIGLNYNLVMQNNSLFVESTIASPFAGGMLQTYNSIQRFESYDLHLEICHQVYRDYFWESVCNFSTQLQWEFHLSNSISTFGCTRNWSTHTSNNLNRLICFMPLSRNFFQMFLESLAKIPHTKQKVRAAEVKHLS